MKKSSNQVFDGTSSELSNDARRLLGFPKSRSLCDWPILIVMSVARIYDDDLMSVLLPNNIMIRVLYREEKEAGADQWALRSLANLRSFKSAISI